MCKEEVISRKYRLYNYVRMNHNMYQHGECMHYTCRHVFSERLVKRGAQGGDQEACQEAGLSTDLIGDLDLKRHVERQVYKQI